MVRNDRRASRLGGSDEDVGDRGGRGGCAQARKEAGAAASMGAQGAAMIRSILSSAAETFAGVFGFLAPLMGPLAIGPAAAAQATVAGMAGAVASADIGMWQVPQDMLTLIHHNELIMPAAEAGALSLAARRHVERRRSARRGPSLFIRPRHFHVSALDGGIRRVTGCDQNGPAWLKALDRGGSSRRRPWPASRLRWPRRG